MSRPLRETPTSHSSEGRCRSRTSDSACLGHSRIRPSSGHRSETRSSTRAPTDQSPLPTRCAGYGAGGLDRSIASLLSPKPVRPLVGETAEERPRATQHPSLSGHGTPGARGRLRPALGSSSHSHPALPGSGAPDPWRTSNGSRTEVCTAPHASACRRRGDLSAPAQACSYAAMVIRSPGGGRSATTEVSSSRDVPLEDHTARHSSRIPTSVPSRRGARPRGRRGADGRETLVR